MDIKKLFRKDDKAVSPVIGVILMVAITVILAAAIGSSVFSHGAAQAAPEANLNIKPSGPYTATASNAIVTVEHLGGDTVNIGPTTTKVLYAIGDNAALEGSITNSDDPVGTNSLNIGDKKKFTVYDNPDPTATGAAAVQVASGETLHIKFIDKNSNQMFCDRAVTF